MPKISHIACLTVGLLLAFSSFGIPGGDDTTTVPLKLVHQKTIVGKLSPKSVVSSGSGLFFAQNMMYRHTITVYNRNYELVKVIRDQVNLDDFGHTNYGENDYRGAPVEADFSHDGVFAWVTNYQMYGDSTTHPGCDGCAISQKYDKSFVYKIDTRSFEIKKVIEVGSVPKYIQATPNNRYVLVSNWSSGDVSVIDTHLDEEIRRIKLGRYPRGIEVDATSSTAYVALMGSDRIAKIDLNDFSVSWIYDVGRAPRHLCLDHSNRFLYASINNENRVIKIDLLNDSITGRVRTGSAPRSMVLSGNDQFLYVVNYFSNKVSKVATFDMSVIENVETRSKPIGITFDDATNNVWVACYSGSLMVFKETAYPEGLIAGDNRLYGLTQYVNRDGQNTYRRGCFHIDGYVQLMRDESYLPPVPDFTVMPAVERKPKPVVADTQPEVVAETIPVSLENTIVETPEPLVEEEATTDVKASESAVADVPANHKYFVIGGSFKGTTNAEVQRQKLIRKGYQNAVIRKRTNGNYLVAFAGFADKEAAKTELRKIRAEFNASAWLWSEE